MAKKRKQVTMTGKQLQDMIARARTNLDGVVNKRNLVQQSLLDVNTAEITLKVLKSGEAKKPLLVSVGGGFFVEAELSNPEKIKELLGGNVILNRDLDQTITLLAERRKNVARELKAVAEDELRARKNLELASRMLVAGRKSVREKVQKTREERKKVKE